MTYQAQPTSFSITKIFGIGVLGVFTLFVLFSIGRLVENVSASDIVVVQSLTGNLRVVTTPGPIWQGLGKVTSFPKRSQYEFETQVRFNDGGHGIMKGSVQWEMPTSETQVLNIYTKFSNPENIQASLIEKVVNKSVYMTGPLMSSTESYAEKRNYLINYVEDQIANGVYKTVQKDVKVMDAITNTEKTAVVVEIVLVNGQPARQEASVLGEFGIRTFNFAIMQLAYDEAVEKQIQAQQQIKMDVQTSIAEARKSEQRTLTTTQTGLANVAQALAEQNVIKAKAVTEAQMNLEVAQKENLQADQYREATLKRADADARARKLKMEADGALEQKLAAYIEVNRNYAIALKEIKVPIVPATVFGGGGNTNSVQSFIDLQTLKAAKDLGLDVTPGR